MSRLNNNSPSASFGPLYIGTIDGSVTFNTSYSALEGGYRIYGAKTVSYLLIPDSNGTGGYDGFVFTSGDDYQDFYGDHSKNGLRGGEIEEVGFYKNAGVIDYGDNTYDTTNFEKYENKIATIPLYGMGFSEFLGKLQSNGSYSNPENLFKELLKDQDLIGGYGGASVQGPVVVDGFAGDDELLIDRSNQLVRGGQGNDLLDGLPFSAAIADGGSGDDVFDGAGSISGRDQIKQHLWVGGSGTNRYSDPAKNTIVVIDQKSQNQSPDIVSFGSTLLAKPEQKTGYIVIKTTNPDVFQLDLKFIDQPLLDNSGKELHYSGYFSVLYNEVEQVRINPMAGGWELDAFIYERDKYEDNIRASIAVARMDQLIVPGNYTEAVLNEIKQDYNLYSLSNRTSVDLTGQTLLDKSNYISIADQFLEPQLDKQLNNYLDKPNRFTRKLSDKITNFNPASDTVEIDIDTFGIQNTATFAAGKSKKVVKKQLTKLDIDFLYDQKKGGLYFNENGADKGFGDGGIIAILKGAPDLTSNNLEFV